MFNFSGPGTYQAAYHAGAMLPVLVLALTIVRYRYLTSCFPGMRHAATHLIGGDTAVGSPPTAPSLVPDEPGHPHQVNQAGEAATLPDLGLHHQRHHLGKGLS